MNGRELLSNAGQISHQIAKDKSEQEYLKYKENKQQLQRCDSLKELEEDIKRLKI